MARHKPEESPNELIVALEGVRTQLAELPRSMDLREFEANASSARNLLHYLALRRVDLRTFQELLAQMGLSSLGHAESHVLENLDSVLGHLYRMAGRPPPERPGESPSEVRAGPGRLHRNASLLLGPSRPDRNTRIMVTMPSEAASQYGLVRDLVAAGMDIMRINCAHDGEVEWGRMISNVHRAGQTLHRRCRVQMDLGGPKLRTGLLEPGPAVLKVRPARDPMGHVVRRARLWLTPADAPQPAPGDCAGAVPLDPAWLGRRGKGDRVRFRDTRGSRRTLRVVEIEGDSRLAELGKTAYLTNGTTLVASGPSDHRDRTVIDGLPPTEQPILLRRDDLFVLTADQILARPGRRGRDGRFRELPVVACTLPEAFPFVHEGDRIVLDDGKITGVVVTAGSRRIRVRVTDGPPEGARLGGDKGINLPDSDLHLPALTERDRADLGFVVRHADIVGYSFVHDATDVELLRRELAHRGHPGLGIMLKIETRQAFDELPAILLSALRARSAGVMIARGDLAVEVGYERLAEVQEEILWLCEAAHLPTVWATQVLEGMTKAGVPSRAEVTDAAMGERAEAVMLNKGPHVVAAVRALDNILRRMQGHQVKKSARLRHLNVAERFFRREGLRADGKDTDLAGGGDPVPGARPRSGPANEPR